MRPDLSMGLVSIPMANISLTRGVLGVCTIWCNAFDEKFYRNPEDGGMFPQIVGGNPFILHGIKTLEPVIW